MSKTKTSGEYSEGLDKTLLKVFDRDVPQTKEQLEKKLTQEGFRRKRIVTKKGTYVDNNYPVTKKQVNYAWDFLQSKKQPTHKQTRFNFTKDKYGNRANDNLFYKGKTYRKGQYIPRSTDYGY